MINLDQISKIYRTSEIETLALENVNLKAKKGEYLSVSEKIRVYVIYETKWMGNFFLIKSKKILYICKSKNSKV